MSRAVYKAVKYNLDEVIKKLQKIVECENCQLVLELEKNIKTDEKLKNTNKLHAR
jgi:hypothetical protein